MSMLVNALMVWEGGSSERPWKRCTYLHSIPCPVHLFCLAVSELHPLIIKLVIITIALSRVLSHLENYQI